MAGIDPGLHRQLGATLRRCDVFASNEKLREIFADKRLTPWASKVPERDNLADRVQATIAFLHNKANVQGQNALALLLYVLRDRYDPNDAYFAELSSLIARLDAPSSLPSPVAPPPAADPYTPYETAMRTLLVRLGKEHPRYNEALIYRQRLTENLEGTRLYGDTETRRAERAEILARLNSFAMATLNTPFTELGSTVTAIHTDGGAYVGGNVTAGGDFVGRDKITIIGDGNVIGNNNQVVVNRPATMPALSDRICLLTLLTRHFSLDELNTLCFAVGVNFDELGGSGLTGKARELIAYCERHGCMPKLLAAGQTLRPELNWS